MSKTEPQCEKCKYTPGYLFYTDNVKIPCPCRMMPVNIPTKALPDEPELIPGILEEAKVWMKANPNSPYTVVGKFSQDTWRWSPWGNGGYQVKTEVWNHADIDQEWLQTDQEATDWRKVSEPESEMEECHKFEVTVTVRKVKSQ